MAAPEKVTAITYVPNKAGRARVYVGKRAVATLSLNTIQSLGIAIGDEWDEATASKVSQAVAFDRAVRDAMRHVNRRMISRQRLGEKLLQRDHDPEIVQRVLDRLQEIGAASDEALGRELIRELRERRGAGPQFLRQKLLAQGLSEELADRLIAEASDADPSDDARRLALDHLPRLAKVDSATRTRRLWGLLARRGFDQDTIARALSGLPGVQTTPHDFES